MPHIVRPPAGWFANANNDPAGLTLGNDPLGRTRPGGGIYYLNYGYDGFRAGRIEQLLRQRLGASRHKNSISALEAMPAAPAPLSAECLLPFTIRPVADAKT